MVISICDDEESGMTLGHQGAVFEMRVLIGARKGGARDVGLS